jgi:glutamate racemase
VERGITGGDEVTVLAERLLAPVRQAGVDTLLLGCTHYPYLARTIGEVMGRHVVLVSSADETAFAVRSLLAGSDRARDRAAGPASARFLSSGDPCWFATLGRRLLGMELGDVAPVRWPA